MFIYHLYKHDDMMIKTFVSTNFDSYSTYVIKYHVWFKHLLIELLSIIVIYI